MSEDRPGYNELKERLARAEAVLEALRKGEVDLVVGPDAPKVLRLKSLVEENERLVREWRTTFDAIKDVVWILDADQRILRSNCAATRTFELDQEAMRGKKCWEIHGMTEPAANCPFSRMRGSLMRETTDMRIGDRWFNVTVDPILDDENNLAGAVHILSDITERKKAEEEHIKLQEQLLQVQKLESVGRLAGGVAHDFNNMLSIILGYGETIFEKLHPGDPLREDVDEILKAGRRSAALTRQLLAFSRKQPLRPEVLDLNDLVCNLEKMLRRLIGEDIELELALAQDIGRVLADPGQMEQAIMNLVVNARDAMPAGGRLLIETAAAELDGIYTKTHPGVVPGKHVLLAVTDTGCGMTDEVKNRLFEPFFTTKDKAKGTGLGLSTVYGIVKQSGGNIWVYSEPGKGTTFKIYLPETQTIQDPLMRTPEAVSAAGGGEHILVVEDEESLGKLAGMLLSRLGYTVTLAANGGEALFLVEERGLKPDLILTDVVMPNMSGKQLIDRLKRHRPNLKALYMSGYTDNAIHHHGGLDRGTPFIQKPFTIGSIARKIREVLDSDER